MKILLDNTVIISYDTVNGHGIFKKYPEAAKHPIGKLINNANDLLEYLKRKASSNPVSIKEYMYKTGLSYDYIVKTLNSNDIEGIARILYKDNKYATENNANSLNNSYAFTKSVIGNITIVPEKE